MRLCPDLEAINDQLQVKNGYSNNEDRISFGIEIHKCDNSDECKSDDEISTFLDNVIWTIYTIEWGIDFYDTSLVGKNPLITHEIFLS